MKKIYWLFLLAVGSAVLQQAFSAGPLPENTGAPGELTCGRAPCHNIPSNAGSAEALIEVSGDGNTYFADSTYRITVSILSTTTVRNGFQLLALNAANRNVGTWILTDPARMQVINGIGLPQRRYVTHTAAGIEQAEWTVDWKAPAADQGKVTFYTSVLAANNNGQNTGDSLYNTSYALQFALPTDVDDPEPAAAIRLHPNPAAAQAWLTLPPGLVCDLLLIDDTGRQLASYPHRQGRTAIDLHQLPPGLYFIQVLTLGQRLRILSLAKF